jgi:hypothetical protein
MELYKITALCTNDSYATHTFNFVPENFEGIKVLQKWSWENPMGYSPKFSVQTMRAIGEDKEYLDTAFDDWGLEAVIEIAIYKLKATGDDYALEATFLIDIDTYRKTSLYSEFALKSISVLDSYNLIKDTDINYVDTHTAILPTTKNYINYISLAKNTTETIETNALMMHFRENSESKIYNYDSALYSEIGSDWVFDSVAYRFNRNAGTTTIAVSASGAMAIFTSEVATEPTFYIRIYKNDFSNVVATLFIEVGGTDGRTDLVLNLAKQVTEDVAFEEGDVFFIGIESDNPSLEFDRIEGTFFVDLYIETEQNINKYSRYLRHTTAETLLNSFFDNNVIIENELKTIGVTSTNQIINSTNYMTLKPKEFLSDFCIATGSIVNFLPSGGVEIKKINTFFPALLSKNNAIEVLDFKDFSIMADTQLNYASVSAGMEQKEYQVYTYFKDWNKVLAWNQAGRVSSKDLNLVLSKFRVDFSGILDAIQKISTKSTGSDKDIFIFDATFTARTGSSVPNVYDIFTPRDIALNWLSFIQTCFHSSWPDWLLLSSDGGSSDNIEIDGEEQFDSIYTFYDEAKVLPLKVELTALIEEIDFSKKILKITEDNAEYFIFVTECETTDNLDEHKITGNLIYFPIEI